MFQITIKRDKSADMSSRHMEARISKFFDEWAYELQEFRKWKTERMQVKDDEVEVICSDGEVKSE